MYLRRTVLTNWPRSTFTPVPKRVMDGSEDGEVLPAAVLSGAPIELQARTVRYAIPHAIPSLPSSYEPNIPFRTHAPTRTYKHTG